MVADGGEGGQPSEGADWPTNYGIACRFKSCPWYMYMYIHVQNADMHNSWRDVIPAWTRDWDWSRSPLPCSASSGQTGRPQPDPAGHPFSCGEHAHVAQSL